MDLPKKPVHWGMAVPAPASTDGTGQKERKRLPPPYFRKTAFISGEFAQAMAFCKPWRAPWQSSPQAQRVHIKPGSAIFEGKNALLHKIGTGIFKPWLATYKISRLKCGARKAWTSMKISQGELDSPPGQFQAEHDI